MSDILQIFTGNPLSTFIGKKVEAATRPDLDSEDWSLNMEICDNINENDDDAKDAARAIRKRLQQIEQDRNFVITNRTLTVLETCVSNCSHRFHVLVMTKDFIQDLVKLIGPKNNPPIDLQERVLSLIERWAEAFKSQPDLNGVWSVYQDLKAKGVTFPQRDPSSSVPIQTPQRTIPAQVSSNLHRARLSGEPQQMQQQPPPIGQLILEGESYNKISQDLAVVQSSLDMLNDIIKVLKSPEVEESDWNLAEDLNLTCRQMKDRIVELIERVANEDLTIELLRLNDELNNLFIKYDRLIKNKSIGQTTARNNPQAPSVADASKLSAQTSQQSSQAGPVSPGPRLPGVSSSTLSELSLIDFNAMKPSVIESTAVSQQAKANDSNSLATDPFDTSNIPAGLVKSSISTSDPDRSNQDKAGQPSSGAKLSDKTQAGLPEEISSVREQDFAEIENWLATDSGRNLNSIGGDTPSIEPISVPNSEFENFIANRALAGSGPSTQQGTKQQSRPEPSV